MTIQKQDSEMAWQERALAAKSDALSSILSLKARGKRELTDLHTHTHTTMAGIYPPWIQNK